MELVFIFELGGLSIRPFRFRESRFAFPDDGALFLIREGLNLLHARQMAAAQVDASLPRVFVSRAPDDVTAFYYYVPQLREQVIRRGLQFSNGYFFGMPDRRGQHQRRPPGFEYPSV